MRNMDVPVTQESTPLLGILKKVGLLDMPRTGLALSSREVGNLFRDGHIRVDAVVITDSQHLLKIGTYYVQVGPARCSCITLRAE